MFIAFVVLAVIMGFILHKTTFGKRLFAIGINRVAAKYFGIRGKRSRLIVYTLSGLFSGITAIFLLARIGSTRPNVAIGYELDIISMCVLGGILTDGGKGNFVGAIIPSLHSDAYAMAAGDGGTEVILGPPFKFDPSNTEEWKTVY